MDSFPIEIPTCRSKLYVVRRWIKNMPVPFRLRRKMLEKFNVFLKSYNIRFHNLPKVYPDDFSFVRFSSSVNKQKRTDRVITIEQNLLLIEDRELRYGSLADTGKKGYVLESEEKSDLPISPQSKKELYETIRKVGFIHFEHENVDVSFDGHGRTGYTVRAFGEEYHFVDATEMPLHPLWLQNCIDLDNFINRLAGLPPIPAIDTFDDYI